MGGDGDDDDGGDGEGDASGPSSNSRSGGRGWGAGGRGGRHAATASNGSSVGTDAASSRAPKRKAPGGRNAADLQGLSSPEVSHVDVSSPPSAPIIKVEGHSDESGVDGDSSVDKGTLKAAIIQHSMTKPRSNSHQGLGNAGSRHYGMQHQHSLSEQNIISSHGMSMPAYQRPSTADESRGPHNFVFPAPPYQRPSSPPRFAFTAEGNNVNPNTNSQASTFLSPQPWTMPTSSSALSPQSSSLHPDDAMTYGDLARGGSNISGLSPQPSLHLQPPTTPQSMSSPSPGPLPSPEEQFFGHSASSANLLPLAHPILRDHPQYAQYANRLRQQQQQSMHSRNASMPLLRTAPSSPNYLSAPSVGNVSSSSPTASAPISPASPASAGHPFTFGEKRSASFGMHPMQSADGRSVHQVASPNFLNPFNAEQGEEIAAAGHYAPSRPSSVMSSHSQTMQQPHHHKQDSASEHRSQPSLDDYASLSGGSVGGSSTSGIPPPPYNSQIGGADAAQHNAPQGTGDESMSNAAFNDLMGSILSDMNAGTADSGNNYQQVGGMNGDVSMPHLHASIAGPAAGVPISAGGLDLKMQHAPSHEGEHRSFGSGHSDNFDPIMTSSGVPGQRP